MVADGRTLVVVADGGRARIFEESRWGGPLSEWCDALAGLTPPAPGRGPAPGSVHDSHGHASHGIRAESPHDKGERAFLICLADRLEALARERPFANLVLIAAPRALGVLREALPPSMKHRLRASEASDRLDADAPHIREALRALRRESA